MLHQKEETIHTLCPEGPDSWYLYKHDKAKDTTSYNPGPGLSDHVIKLVKPISARLGDDELLTLNQNKSLNRMSQKSLAKKVNL